MNCDEADAMLLDYVEGELDDSQSDLLRTHLEGCQSCRFHLRDTRKLLGVMDDVKERQEQIIERRAARRSRMGARTGASRSNLLSGVSPTAIWRPGAKLGDFEIISEIGRGGMGVVFRARQVSLHREVALKILPSAFGSDEKVIARFQREAQAAARLHHTNIVPVYAQGQQDGHFYYAMELIDGEALDHVIRARQEDKDSPTGTISESLSQSKIHNLKSRIHASGITRTIWTMQAHGLWRDYARLICGAAEGIAHAHSQGVLHRDIKPQNLLLGADNELHITDFGLARILDEPGMTVTGEMLGTPAYMSPEQVAADRQAIDHRTDIFSLGSTFYELLTGQRPFEGTTRDQVVARICTREPRSPRKINPRIPVDLETICMRALEKESSRRYQSAADMAADLRRYAENRPILARRVGPIEKAVKWIRRHPALTTIIVLTLGIIGGSTAWRYQIMRTRHEKAQELVAKAFNMLAGEDYREPEIPLQYLNQAAALGETTASYDITMALAHLRKDPPTAIAQLQIALSRAANDSNLTIRILYLLAWAERLNTGRLDGPAQKHIDQADQLGGPREAEDHFFRGQALVQHKPDLAIKEYREARDIRNNYAQALLQLGRGLNSWFYHERKHDNFGEEVRHLEYACMLQPKKAYPRYLLSICHRISGEIYEADGKPEDAKKDFEKARFYALEAQSVETNSPNGYICEAEYWESMRDYEKAISLRNRSQLRCQSKDEINEVYVYRWRLYFWTGQHEKALADLSQLVERAKLHTSGQANHYTIWARGVFPALVHQELGNHAEALRYLNDSVASSPHSFCAVTSAAGMMEVLGDTERAQELLKNAERQIEFAAFQQGENQPTDWGQRVYGMCAHTKSLADLERELGTERIEDKLLWPAAYFIDGCQKLGVGMRPEALRSFRRSLNTYDYEDYCYLAKVFIRRMEMDENWPNWAKTHP